MPEIPHISAMPNFKLQNANCKFDNDKIHIFQNYYSLFFSAISIDLPIISRNPFHSSD
jgi:hypothetical protein